MIKHIPFIHVFKTCGGHYFFDVNRNSILRISKPVYDYLKSKLEGLPDCGTDLNQEDVETLTQLISEGFLSDKKVSEIANPINDYIEYHTCNRLSMLCLQTTQQCNFRCSYCLYSDNYTNRKHSDRKMSIETAKKGIDFLVNHSSDSHRLYIAFYGGEPLLELDFIKHCVEYAEEICEGKELVFSMTTNGSLLNEKVVRYLQEHNFQIMVSLDGPKDIHDSNRKFINNKGTFDKVINNLKMIKNKFPEYYSGIAINAVIDTRNDLESINNFFMNDDNVKDVYLNHSFISDFYTDNRVTGQESFYTFRKYEVFKAFLSKINRCDKKHVSPFANSDLFFLTECIHKQLKMTDNLLEKAHPGGPCSAVERLFMNVDGDFYPCERVSEISETMRIGNVDSGFDIDKILKLINIGRLTEEECKQCWAFRYCNLCAASVDTLSDLSAEKKLALCKSVRETIEGAFIDYCTLKECGADFDNGEVLKNTTDCRWSLYE